MIIPKKLAIFYAYPSTINGTYTVPAAVLVYNDYDLVVFGAGVEEISHPDHQNTIDIIANSSADFFGYIDATLNLNVIKNKISKWATMGVEGIFIDQFGFDFGLTRGKQNSILNDVHTKNLIAFVNAWEPDDVFQQVNNVACCIKPGDWYLAQSHYIKEGEYQNLNEWETKSNKLVNYKQTFNINVACITTTISSIGFDQNKWDNAYYAHAIYNFDASGWGEPLFSAQSAQLPFRQRKDIYGTEFIGNIVTNGSVKSRETNVGIYIDTITRTVSEILFL